jgi:hypothetical protein
MPCMDSVSLSGGRGWAGLPHAPHECRPRPCLISIHTVWAAEILQGLSLSLSTCLVEEGFYLHPFIFATKFLNESSHLSVKMTTTEVATVPFLAGTSISDSKRMLQETFADLDKVDGFQSFHLGTSFESPEDLQILVGKKKTVTNVPQNFRELVSDAVWKFYYD